jgi:hypothetical protein
VSKNSAFKPIALIQNSLFNRLQQQVTAQQHLTQDIKKALPESLANQVQHSLLKQTVLIVYTGSANWASQLRFYSSVIMEAGSTSNNTRISAVHIKIIAKPTVPEPHKHKANRLSTEKIEFLHSYSHSVQDDQLKKSLLKLTHTLKQFSGHTH